MKPSFTSKEQYLQWRAEWRARYLELSHDIHWLRLFIAARQSGLGNKKWDSARIKLLEIQKKYTNKETGICNPWRIFSLRAEARQMLEWRKESKLLAQAQYRSQHPAYSLPA